MKRATRSCHAAGFTLVELLVVISIIAVLLALSGAAYQKAADSQRSRSTDDLMNRLQPALDAEYDAVVKQCAKDRQNNAIDPNIVAWCDGDGDRAQAVWTAAKLRQNFPQSFAELTPFQVCPGSIQLPVMSTFSSLSGLSGGTADQQSAVLLYAFLSKKAAGGSGGFAADDVTNGMQMDVTFTGGTARAFRDSWSRPVNFIRWCSVAEVQSPPYVSASATSKDPLDPLSTNGTPKVSGWVLADGVTANPKVAQLANSPFLLVFNGSNRTPTVWSYGKTVVDSSNNPTPADDRYGFRLRRLGNRGGN